MRTVKVRFQKAGEGSGDKRSGTSVKRGEGLGFAL